jgi:hypothetical protein
LASIVPIDDATNVALRRLMQADAGSVIVHPIPAISFNGLVMINSHLNASIENW